MKKERSFPFRKGGVAQDSVSLFSPLPADQKMSETDFEKRQTVVALRRKGFSAETIHERWGYNVSFINRWWGRYLRGEGLRDRPRTGRPGKLTSAAKKKLRVFLKRKKGGSSRAAAASLASATGIHVDHSTVLRYAHSNALKFRVRPKKPKLTEKQKAARVAFASAQRPNGYWRNVFFTDEKTYGISYEQRGQWLEVYEEAEPRATEKYGISVRVWGGVGDRGLTPLYRIPKSMTGPEYQQFLETKVFPDMVRLYGTGWIFEQDGDGTHSAHMVRRWLSEQPVGWIENWPSGSPDISIVENLWPILGQRMVGSKVRTADGLWRRLREEWEKIPIAICRNLADSMDKRLRLVRQTAGQPIKY